MNVLSDGQSEESWEWTGLSTGALAGLAFILLTNVFPGLIPSEYFALLNVLSFICILLSPYAFNVALFGSSERRRLRVAMIVCYLILAPIVGWMIALLARGDNYYGFIVIPGEVSWVVVAVIAVLLLIPLINWLSLIPIAAWLGSLLYYKVYPSSYLSRALIGSPLFALPLLVLLGYETCRVIRAHREVLYVFDTVSGELTSHYSLRRKIPLRRVLAISSLFLIGSSAVVTGLATWNRIEEAEIVRLSDFQAFSEISHEGSYLAVSFSLINARNKTTAADGMAELSIHDKNGSLIFKDGFSFSQKDFRDIKYTNYQKQILTHTVPGDSFLAAVISRNVSIVDLATGCFRDSIGSGYAALKVSIDNGRKILTATCPTRFYCETENLIRLYYQSEIKKLQLELNQQWSFKVSISNYLRIGNYCWAIVGRTGGEIVFYPGKIYSWYFLQSEDGGCMWDISWKGDGYPLFRSEFLSEKEIRIVTSYANFTTRDGGETWE